MFTSAQNLRRMLAVGVVATLTAGLVSTSAAAHTELRGSDPEQGSTVETLEQVRLEFSSALLDIGAELALIDADGTSHALVPEFPEGEHAVVAAVPVTDVAAGETVLDWRIVAEDGHPISGEITFTYAPAVQEPAPEPTETAETPPAAESPAEQEEPAPEAESLIEPTPITEEPISEEPEAANGAVWAWVLVGLAVVGLVVTAVAMNRKRNQE